LEWRETTEAPIAGRLLASGDAIGVGLEKWVYIYINSARHWVES
jgi:hypothetical protein